MWWDYILKNLKLEGRNIENLLVQKSSFFNKAALKYESEKIDKNSAKPICGSFSKPLWKSSCYRYCVKEKHRFSHRSDINKQLSINNNNDVVDIFTLPWTWNPIFSRNHYKSVYVECKYKLKWFNTISFYKILTKLKRKSPLFGKKMTPKFNR